MSQQILDGLYTLLSTDQGGGSVWDAVGGRIYPHQAPQDADLPLIVYNGTANPITRYMGTAREQALTVRVDIFSDLPSGANALGAIEELLYQLLESATLVVDSHDRGTMTCTARDGRVVEEDAHHSISEYRIQSVSMS